MREESRQERGARSEDAARAVWSLAQIRHLLRVEFGRTRRYGEALAVLLIALDGLTELRARAGHEAKERAIERTAELLSHRTRACDHAGRFTLERFLVLVPRTDGEALDALARRLLEAVREPGPEPGAAPLSLSIGVAYGVGDEVLFHDDLLAAAERALADAQAAGGGRLVIQRAAAG